MNTKEIIETELHTLCEKHNQEAIIVLYDYEANGSTGFFCKYPLAMNTKEIIETELHTLCEKHNKEAIIVLYDYEANGSTGFFCTYPLAKRVYEELVSLLDSTDTTSH
jgi:choline kinase